MSTGLSLAVGLALSGDASGSSRSIGRRHHRVHSPHRELSSEAVPLSDSSDLSADDTSDTPIVPDVPSGSAVTPKPVKIGLKREHGNLYFYRNGEPVSDTLVKTGGKVFYFGSSGRAFTNRWRKIDDNWYYFKKKGRAAVGSVKIRKNFRIFNKYAHLCCVTNQKAVKAAATSA